MKVPQIWTRVPYGAENMKVPFNLNKWQTGVQTSLRSIASPMRTIATYLNWLLSTNLLEVLPPVQFPGPWWSSSSTPGSQTGRSSLPPGPVLC